jgi:predicted negative regulator of RcsB-dependent stress response
MSSEETKKPVDADVESESGDPVESMFVSLTQNWKELLVGLVIALALLGSFMFYQSRTRKAREQAFTQLAVASTLAQFNEISRQFPSSKAAEMAALMAARTQYDSGDFAEADKFYTDFISQHPKHYMVPAAKLGRVHCMEATAQPEEALAGFEQFVKDYPSEIALCTVAKLGMARCLRAMGKAQDAIAVYDTLILEQPDSEWKPLIEDLKNATVKDLERLSAQTVPAAAAAPALPAAPVLPAPAAP